MKHSNLISGVLTSIAMCVLASAASAQSAPSFHKGSFRINLTEGSTHSTYGTGEINNKGGKENLQHMIGDRDPLQLEYGLSNHWGIGVTMGNDIFNNINSSAFYGFQTPGDLVKAKTSEFTLDGSYHFFVTPLTDFSVVGSFGSASVLIQGGNGDCAYNYNAAGGIVRLGLHARYYILRYVGVVAMVSAYSENVSPQGVRGNNVGAGYATSISGVDVEGGICIRFSRK